MIYIAALLNLAVLAYWQALESDAMRNVLLKKGGWTKVPQV